MNLDKPYTSKYVTRMERLFGVKCPRCNRKMKRLKYYSFNSIQPKNHFELVWKCLGCGHMVFHNLKN